MSKQTEPSNAAKMFGISMFCLGMIIALSVSLLGFSALVSLVWNVGIVPLVQTNPLTILEIWGIICLSFSLIGIIAGFLMGFVVKKGKDEF